MKIFWAWQSDIPGKYGRHFVRDALHEAIKELKVPEEVTEPTEQQRREELHLDHDRKDVPGSPDLANTILEKIDAAGVFVADVTCVATIPKREENGTTIPEKRILNPNVGIELGYALKGLSDKKILMVMNTYYGGREFLPFDLRHKAGPIEFDLPPDADSKKMKSEATKLKGLFKTYLRPFIEQPSAVSTFRAMPSKASQAAYFDPP